MWPAGGLVLRRQVLRKIKVDGKQALWRLDQEPTLPQPPDDKRARRWDRRGDLVDQFTAVANGL